MKAVLSSADITRALTRISHEIIEKNHGSDDIVLLGIPTRGVFLAERIANEMGRIDSHEIPVGTLDITLHRDDLRSKPPRALTPTRIPGDSIDGKRVVLVDDVLYSGRTIRAALDALGEIWSSGFGSVSRSSRSGPSRVTNTSRLCRKEFTNFTR